MVSDAQDACVCVCVGGNAIKASQRAVKACMNSRWCCQLNISFYLAPFISVYLSLFLRLTLLFPSYTRLCSLYLFVRALSALCLSPSLPAVLCGDRGSLCQVRSPLSHDSVIEMV